jgi:uncharacterized protein
VVVIVLMFLAVILGALIQGSVGFGFALIVVPILALADPESLPATVLLLALPLSSVVAFRERHSIDLLGFYWLTGGRLLGIAGGLGLLVMVPTRYLSVLTGGLILSAVIMSLLDPDFRVKNKTRLVGGGVASGVMGTAAGVGGPPLAIVYQNRPGPELRSTIALSFALGNVVSLLGLVLVGELGEHQLRLALLLFPSLLLGLWGSRKTSEFLDRQRWLRSAILTFAAVCGVAIVFLGS